MMRKITSTVLLSLALAGCSFKGPSPTEPSVYEALGAKPGVELLSRNFIRELAANETLRARFSKSDIGRFDQMIQLHLCSVTGGNCKYPGASMKKTHGGMNITTNEFNLVVEAMIRAMDKTELSVGTQNRLLAILAPMRDDIVGQ